MRHKQQYGSPPLGKLSPASYRLWSHVEGLRLAAAAKLPPLSICATRQLRGEREMGNRE